MLTAGRLLDRVNTLLVNSQHYQVSKKV